MTGGPTTLAPRARLGRGSAAARAIALRSNDDIAGIRRAGAVLAEALESARAACVAGATTGELDRVVRDSIESAGAQALFLGYRGNGPAAGRRPAYPAASCISVNDELVHGVPGFRRIESGDIVSIDAGVRLDGWCADAAITVCVGEVSAARHALAQTAEQMLALAVRRMVPGCRWSSIATEMERLAVDAGFTVAVDFVGHGIGRELHEAPQVPCASGRGFLTSGDFTLRPGMVLAIEPMLVDELPRRDETGDLLSPRATLADDGWTVVLDSGASSCQCEHTVVVTRDGAEILTARAARPAHQEPMLRRVG